MQLISPLMTEPDTASCYNRPVIRRSPAAAACDAVRARRVLQLGLRQPLRRPRARQLRPRGRGHAQLQVARPRATCHVSCLTPRAQARRARVPEHQHGAAPAPAGQPPASPNTHRVNINHWRFLCFGEHFLPTSYIMLSLTLTPPCRWRTTG